MQSVNYRLFLCILTVLTLVHTQTRAGWFEEISLLKVIICAGLITTPLLIKYLCEKIEKKRLKSIQTTVDNIQETCASKDEIAALKNELLAMINQQNSNLKSQFQSFESTQQQMQQTQALINNRTVLLQNIVEGIRSAIALNQQQNLLKFDEILMQIRLSALSPDQIIDIFMCIFERLLPESQIKRNALLTLSQDSGAIRAIEHKPNQPLHLKTNE